MSAGKRIAIIGPESTGKTILSQNLAKYYNGIWIPEYARQYISELNRPYGYNDVLHIAHWIIDTYHKYKDEEKPVFFDTEMIITKVWFDVAYNKVPEEVSSWLHEMKFDAYLLCYPDLAWEPDPVRENGGEMRKILFERYKQEIETINGKYKTIKEEGKNRIINACKALSEFNCLPDLSTIVLQDHNLVIQPR